MHQTSEMHLKIVGGLCWTYNKFYDEIVKSMQTSPCFVSALMPIVLSSGGSDEGRGGGIISPFITCDCRGGGLIAGFGGKAGFGLLSVSGILCSGGKTTLFWGHKDSSTFDEFLYEVGDNKSLELDNVWGSTACTFIDVVW